MIDFFYPSLHKLSGAERVILCLSEELARAGQPVRVTTQAISDPVRAAWPAGVALNLYPIYKFSANHYWNSLREYWVGVPLVSRIRHESDGFCFFGAPSLPALVYVKRTQGARVPCLHYCYEPVRALYQDQQAIRERLGPAVLLWPLLSAYKWMDRYAVRQADGLMTVSRYSASLVKQAYGLCARPLTLGPGLKLSVADAEAINRLRVRYAATTQTRFILTVNSLHPRKRIDDLIRAMPIILQSYPDTRALIVGVGPECARLQDLCGELQIASQIIFTGFVPDACLSAYYALADVYVHTTRNESLGLAIIEAAAAGLPVVAVNEGGVGETIVHAETGLLVPAAPSALGAAVRSLLADPQRARQMGAAGQARVNRLNRWELAAQEFMQVWTAARERKHV